MIPAIPLVTETVRPLNARLFELCGKEAGGKITKAEKHELDCLCEWLEREGDASSSGGRSGLLRTEPCSTVSAVPGPAAIARSAQ